MPSIRASARESDARKGDVPMRQSHREAIISMREMIAQGLVAEDDLAVHEPEGLVDRCHRLTVVPAAVRLEERLL